MLATSMNPTERQCGFFLLRYVPNALREEFVNIGVVLREGAGGEVAVRFAPDWRRVRCLDPDADTELLDALVVDVKRRLGDAQDRTTLVKLMEDSFSSSIQISPEQAVLTASVDDEVRRLAQMYLENPKVMADAREARGRAAIFHTMRTAFERAGVWGLPQMRHNIAVAPYTRSGDPLKLDCGYQPNGVVKLFHAVSLEADANLAKVLAYSFPQVREGIARTQKAEATLTAVVEPDLDQNDAPVAFALETLVAASVQVATAAQMEPIAETARLELRA
jgi:DUF3037 family protein